MTRRTAVSAMTSSTTSTRSQAIKGHPHTSTPASFTEDEVDRTVNTVFRASPSVQPRRFAMEDILKVDHKSIELLQASSRWKRSLPHIERIIETERATPSTTASFVARTFRQRPGVVYAVR